MTVSVRSAALVVETTPLDSVPDLIALADPTAPTLWQRRGDGLVGTGGIAASFGGLGGAREAATTWQQLTETAEITDHVGVPGTGLVAFGSLPFHPDSETASRFIVPRIVVGTRDGVSWITRVRAQGDDVSPEKPAPQPFGPHWSATLGPGSLTAGGYQRAVRDAVEAIHAGRAAKVVLARDLSGTIPADADLRRLVRALATNYPDTWTFAVAGLIGASPETLITVTAGALSARVLAGTTARGADAAADASAAALLAASGKDLREHAFAVRSVAQALEGLASDLQVPQLPHLLELPNVWHLATDVAGTVAGGATSLDLVAALHPTAAVAGTPTDAALGLIRELEPTDRGRYAGPVGWMDARGDGEWAIALRCAQIGDPAESGEATRSVLAHAGAGIVADSDPETELLETRVKFRPIVDALA